MEYPRDRLYVQCLDDSTDPETREVFYEGVRHWQALGIKIEAIRRTNRKGYKAGAMHEVHDAPAEFIAIFDADFLPESNEVIFSGALASGQLVTGTYDLATGTLSVTNIAATGAISDIEAIAPVEAPG